MSVFAVAGSVSAGAAALGWWITERTLYRRPALRTSNHRGRDVAFPGGLVLVAAVVVAELVVTVGTAVPAGADGPRRAAVAAVVGFALVGWVDDRWGDSGVSGFGGHLRALARGKITTGLAKIAGGLAVATVAVWWAVPGHPAPLILADTVLVALAANTVNLCDRRPGRAAKVTVLAGALVIGGAGADPRVATTAMVVAATVVLAVPDLREELMLGDTGANPMGAAIGMGVVVAGSSVVRLGVLTLVVVANLAAERVSYSDVIQANAPLRWLDGLGGREE